MIKYHRHEPELNKALIPPEGFGNLPRTNAAVAAARLGIKCFLRVEGHSGEIKCEKQMQEDVPFWKLIQSRKIGLIWWT